MRPEPFSLLWQRSILQTLRNSMRATQRDLKRHLRDHPELADHRGIALFDQQTSDMLSRFDRLRSTKIDAHRIRIHGDLHLGQVLWNGHDVTFIDFEGEPGQPIGQRRIKRSPLADVGGLVRSFDYAGRMAVHTAAERGRVPPSDLETIESWRREWTSTVQGRLVDAYLPGLHESGLIPSDPDDVRLLLDVYTLIKCLYEVRYELANRPDWVAWPLSAVGGLLEPERGSR